MQRLCQRYVASGKSSNNIYHKLQIHSEAYTTWHKITNYTQQVFNYYVR